MQQVREELWKESQKYGVDVPFERFCVRMKSRKSPAKIFADHETIGNEDIPLYANWEIFVQVLTSELFLFLCVVGFPLKRKDKKKERENVDENQQKNCQINFAYFFPRFSVAILTIMWHCL